MHCVGIRNLKLWQTLLLVFALNQVLRTGLNVSPCYALSDIVQATPLRDGEFNQWMSDSANSTDYGTHGQPPLPSSYERTYFFEHNESRVALALAEAAAANEGGATARASLTFPQWNSSDGCVLSTAWRDLSVYPWNSPYSADMVDVSVIAVEGCTMQKELYLGQQPFEVSSKLWRVPDPEIVKPRDYVKVLVQIHTGVMDILGEGVYFPATGKMHLVGCTRKVMREVAMGTFTSYEEYRSETGKLSEFEAEYTYFGYDDSSVLKRVTSSGVCAMAVTLQYPPWNTRWNWQRVVKLTLRSMRDDGDALYFDPVERSVFYPGLRRRDRFGNYDIQRRLATGARILVLLIGLVFLALQIRHGGNHEEALPFTSLAMLGIQIANHVSQTPIFKDLQIGRYDKMMDFRSRAVYGPSYWLSDGPSYMQSSPTDEEFAFLDSVADFTYYGSRAWHDYVPYQAMAMAAIFMYVWLFHRVGDRRRIMQLRVRRGRPGAVNPPRDGQIVFATVTLFAIVGVIGVVANVVSNRFNALGEPGSLFGNTNSTAFYSEMALGDEFVSPKFYELWNAHWGVVNKVTGLVVSLFLLPQLLGNWRWEVQGRPLSKWFYIGLPLLQALPQLLVIAQYFQLLPIFDFYDPYLDSFYGLYENPILWWQIVVVSSSALLVVAVHFQFATSFRPARSHASGFPGTSHPQAGDIL